MKSINDDQALAIVGMGCLFPKADTVDRYWANILAKTDAIGPIPPSHWNPDEYFDEDAKRADFTYARRGGFLDAYPFAPAEFGIAPRDLEAIDTAQLLGLVVAKMALEDAGLLAAHVDRNRISVILGVTGTLEMVIPLGARLGHPLWKKAMRAAGVDEATAAEIQRRIADGYVSWQENSFPGLLGNVVAGRIANRLNLGGTNCVVDAACASSLSALHMAALELQTGRADAVLTGGVDTFNDIFMYMCFSKTPALSPTGDARPFAADADGTILGEGLGMLVVKRLVDAEVAGDRIYAVVRGIGTSSDGAGNAVYAPTADGQIRCLRDAYSRAGISPSTLGLIEAHGTGTKVGDATEIEALATVFRDARPTGTWCTVGSIKSQLGHTKAAAGVAGLIKATLALQHRVLPPTAKVREPAPALNHSPFSVGTEPRPWVARDEHPRRAGVSSFGFGGSNFHVVLEEYPRNNAAPAFDGDTQIVTFSAESQKALIGQIDRFPRTSDWPAFRRAAHHSRRNFDRRNDYRVTMVIQRTGAHLDSVIAAAKSMLDQGKSSESVFVGRGRPGKLGALFPGQGTQSVGMLRELACVFPIFSDVLAQADRAFAAGFIYPPDVRLSDFIYPPATFAPNERAAQEIQLRNSSVAQPALGAVSLATLHVLRQFGVKPDVAAGHSYGELTALCAAGCFDAPSLFALSQLRGRLMTGNSESKHISNPGGHGEQLDQGSMLAVMAPLAKVETAIAEDKLGVVIANRNSPAQAVLSGPTREIERAELALTDRQLRHVRLPVAAAFHSPLVAHAVGPFRSALEPISFVEAQLPVFSNATSGEYPRDPQAVRDLLAAQLANPVDFAAQIRNMSLAGVTTFLEIGPGHTLTRLVDAILHDAPHRALAIDGPHPGIAGLAAALAELAASGHHVDLTMWDPNPPAERVTRGPIIPLSGANYRPNKPPEPPRTIPATSAIVAKPNDAALRPAEVSDGLLRALQMTQDSLAAFQKLQQQTAELHRTFLEQQTQAQQTLQTLLAGQQQLLAAQMGIADQTKAAGCRESRVTNGFAGQNATPAAPMSPPPPVNTIAMEQSFPIATPVPAPTNDRETDGGGNPSLTKLLLDIVVEKTGYPLEMLNLEMRLDEDLGIDSIKRVEILSALQDQLPGLPGVSADRLGGLRTLADVVTLLETKPAPMRQVGPSSEREGSDQKSEDRRPNGSSLAELLLNVVAEKTGYPIDMLDLDMGLDTDLGIDSIKRVEILSAVQDRWPAAPTVSADRLGSWRSLRDVIQSLETDQAEKKNARPTLAR